MAINCDLGHSLFMDKGRIKFFCGSSEKFRFLWPHSGFTSEGNLCAIWTSRKYTITLFLKQPQNQHIFIYVESHLRIFIFIFPPVFKANKLSFFKKFVHMFNRITFSVKFVWHTHYTYTYLSYNECIIM